MDYTITMGTRAAGRVQLLQEGLYVRIICRVRLRGSTVYRLVAEQGTIRENLGILTPVGDGFGLDRRIPAKHLPQGELTFQLIPSHEPMDSRFVPIRPQEPFLYLDRLRDAYLEKRDGELGVRIPI